MSVKAAVAAVFVVLVAANAYATPTPPATSTPKPSKTPITGPTPSPGQPTATPFGNCSQNYSSQLCCTDLSCSPARPVPPNDTWANSTCINCVQNQSDPGAFDCGTFDCCMGSRRYCTGPNGAACVADSQCGAGGICCQECGGFCHTDCTDALGVSNCGFATSSCKDDGDPCEVHYQDSTYSGLADCNTTANAAVCGAGKNCGLDFTNQLCFWDQTCATIADNACASSCGCPTMTPTPTITPTPTATFTSVATPTPTPVFCADCIQCSGFAPSATPSPTFTPGGMTPTPGASPGNCCELGSPVATPLPGLNAGCDGPSGCENCVCVLRASCCIFGQGWDSICVQLAATSCDNYCFCEPAGTTPTPTRSPTRTPTPTFTPAPTPTKTPTRTPTPTVTTTPGSCCAPHTLPGCDDGTCQACVCLLDSDCCSVTWSNTCSDHALFDCNCVSEGCPTPTATPTPSPTPT